MIGNNVNITNSNIITKIKTDVLVIGAGGAGLSAAVSARENGADVLVLEKRSTPGGNAAMAGGPFAAESKLQRQLRIDARRDELFKMHMDFTHWQVNPRIVRAYIDKSAETIQWLEDKGVIFGSVSRMYPNQLLPTWHKADGGQKIGKLIVKRLLKSCDDTGIQLFYRTAAKKILTDDNGEVIGVLAGPNQQEMIVGARSIIISTGGYAGNKELLKKYCPYYTEDIYRSGLPHMGDGLLMATEIGAATEGLGVLLVSAPTLGTSRKRFPLAQCLTAEANTLWVNKRGERFVDESIGFISPAAIGPVVRQPDKTSYTLFDKGIVQKVTEEGLIVGSHNISPTTKLVGLEKELKEAVDDKNNVVKTSDSWEGIARWIGTEPEILKATIEEYNSFCDKGHDDIFAKERRYLQALRTPPYYALQCHPSFSTTMGGIKITHRMEVLGHNDELIPGLYAVGDVAGGWEWDNYNMVLSGFALGFALNSGRIAGENATRYISQKLL